MMKSLFRTIAVPAIAGIVVGCVTGCGGCATPDGLHLDTAAKTHGLRPPHKEGNDIIVEGENRSLIFHSKSRKLEVDGVLVWLHDPLAVDGPDWQTSSNDMRSVVSPLLDPDKVIANAPLGPVILDPGHGGRDSGALSPNGIKEKDIVLDISRRVRVLLEKEGIAVKQTRNNDRYISLKERASIAAILGGSAYVSIHLNNGSAPTAAGCETFVIASAGSQGTSGSIDGRKYTGNAHEAESTVLGYCLQKGVVLYAKAKDRGLKRARFQVLRDADCPSALIECGFLSNPAEESRLRTDEHRHKLSEGIARGIISYLNRVREAQATLDKS